MKIQWMGCPFFMVIEELVISMVIEDREKNGKVVGTWCHDDGNIEIVPWRDGKMMMEYDMCEHMGKDDDNY